MLTVLFFLFVAITASIDAKHHVIVFQLGEWPAAGTEHSPWWLSVNEYMGISNFIMCPSYLIQIILTSYFNCGVDSIYYFKFYKIAPND